MNRLGYGASARLDQSRIWEKVTPDLGSSTLCVKLTGLIPNLLALAGVAPNMGNSLCRHIASMGNSVRPDQWALGSVYDWIANKPRASRSPSATLCGMPLTGVTIMNRISPVWGRAIITLQGRSSEWRFRLQAQLPVALMRSERQPADPPEVVEIWLAA